MASNNYPKTKGGAFSDSLLEKIREGDFRPNFPPEEEKNNSKKRFEGLQQNQKKEHLIFTQKKQDELNQRVVLEEKIQTEIKNNPHLLKQEEATAVEKKTETTGKYHLNFLGKIASLISQRKKLENSATWREAFEGKQKKRGYWAGVKKSGTKFMSSADRQVATSVG